MKSRLLPAALVAASVFTPLFAQSPAATTPAQPAAMTVPPPAIPRARISPHETISLKVDGNRVTLIYGRPYSKDPKTGAIRKIWGGLVPYGKVWRTGSDEATTFITQQAIDLGGTVIPAGTYTLFTVPMEDGSAQLAVNKEFGQWGVDPYDEKHELARISLKKDTLATQLDQFVMALEKNPAGGAVLKMAWANTQFSLPFTLNK
ncbi:MAG: DUF2911 domain-containing protein [Lacunisphaera sp.]|nr:DUF2911 domain-containing protein [Lacunisphaera sp.]